ncbi:MAG: hypothetical protein Q8S13_01500 [Dehalococcoidia bacterium]|nr:hypothetical protein [Dehalococcoidia bacterium]
MGKDEAKQLLLQAVEKLEAARGQFGCGWCEGRNDAVITFARNLYETTDTAVELNRKIGSLDKKKIEIEQAEYDRLVEAAHEGGLKASPAVARPKLLAPPQETKPKPEAAGVMTRLRESRGPFRSTLSSLRESIPRPKDFFEG